MLQQAPDLSQVSDDKKDIINMGFSMSIHVLRSFYEELLDKIKTHSGTQKLKDKLDELMPPLEPGGFRIAHENKEYSLMFQKCKADYDLNREVNKIPNLISLSDLDKQKILKEIDIAVSSVPCVYNKYMGRDDFKQLLKDMFDIFDEEFSAEVADEYKDVALKMNQHQRTYQVIEPNGVKFGLHVNKL